MAKYRNDKIRGKQAELGLTVDDVATKARVSDRTVIAVRKGRPVSTETLERIADALCMTMQEVYAPNADSKEAELATTG